MKVIEKEEKDNREGLKITSEKFPGSSLIPRPRK